jgi:ABC-type bacteriocin/lantibiotic exporters, contain an N-terminal double-glycine peptidase domain
MLRKVIERAARLVGQKVSSSARAKIDALEATGARSVLELVQQAWELAGLEQSPSIVGEVSPADCPFLIKHRHLGLLVVESGTDQGQWTAQDSNGKTHQLHFSRNVRAIKFPRMQEAPPTLFNTSALVMREVRKHKAIFVESLLATFLVDIIGLSTSLFSMQVYDRVIPSRGYDTLVVLGVGVGVAILMGFILNSARSYVLDKTTTKIDNALSNWFYLRALGIRMEQRPMAVGAFAAQVKGLEMLRGILCSTSLFLIADVPFALVFIAVIFCIGGPLGWVPVVLFPVSLLLGLLFQSRLNRLSMDNQRDLMDKTGLLVESLDAIETIKANGAGGMLAGRWSRATEAISGRDERIKFISALSSYATGLLQQVGYISIVAFGAYLVTENLLTTGGLLACSIICSRALSPVGRLPGVMLQWANLRAVKRGLDSLLARPNEMDDQDSALNPDRLESSLRMDQVLFRYMGSDQKALIVPKMEIKPGERVGVIGAIGSGKSTLLKLASGLYRPGEGRVFIGGLDASHIAPQRLQQFVAYIPQDVRLLSGTLRDNLLQGLPDPGDSALLEAMQSTGLSDMVNNHPKGIFLPIEEGGRGISGGQRQLIAITRLLLAKPAVILLDEPTASMDAGTEAKVVGLLDTLAAAGSTLVVATHRTAILPIMDRLMVFERGMFALDGPRDLVLARLAGQGVRVGQAPAPASNVVPMPQRNLQGLRDIKAAS